MLVSKAENETAVLEIHSDESPESPREWDNLGMTVCFHRNYNLGDKHHYRSGDYTGWDGLKDQIIKDHKPVAILPLYLMDHSGLTISIDDSMFRACDSQGWDWAQIGWIFCPGERARREFGARRITKAIQDKAVEVLQGEVAVYDEYLRGNVYGFVLRDKITGEEDSCWGFYGDCKNNGMAEHLGEYAALLDGLNYAVGCSW